MAGSRPIRAKPKSSGLSWTSAPPIGLIVVYFATLVVLALHGMHRRPPAVPATVPTSAFSEGRARGHVATLTKAIGFRAVATPGLEEAHQYLLSHARQLQQAAEARGDMTVQVDAEHYRGDFPAMFLGKQFWNSYSNITNIIVHIARKGSEHKPAVMVVAHHDSPVSSAGAGDDASNVAVMLELATNLLATPADQLPEHPVLLLFSGAEEPLCQSANAWSQFSKWVNRVGVFINLESMGPGGVPIVFQHAGSWVMEAYARSAKVPRGSIAGQEVFDAGLIVGDTDFTQLAYTKMGQLPGIDIAYLLDGAAYHTDRDTLERMPEGVLQETGEMLRAVVGELSRTMAAADAEGTLDQLLHPKDTDRKAVFFGIGASYMLTYSSATAKVLAQAPLAVALSMPMVMGMVSPSKAQMLPQALRMTLGGAGRGLASAALVLGGTAVFGAARALITGVPMFWFGQAWLAYCTYFPVAVALMFLPWQSCDYNTLKGQQRLPYHVLGAATINVAIGAVMGQLGVGIGGAFSFWGVCGLLAAMLLLEPLTTKRLLAVLVVMLPPVFLCCETSLVLMVALLTRLTLSGHVFVGLGDAIAGLLLGLGATSCSGQVLVPVMRSYLGSNCRRLTTTVLLAATALALIGSYSVSPYSHEMPKRLLLSHLHHTAPAAAAVAAEGSQTQVWPSMSVVKSSWALSGTDSTPVSRIVSAMQLNASSGQGDEWLVVYPISEMLDTLVSPAPGYTVDTPRMPAVRLVSGTIKNLASGAAAGAEAAAAAGVLVREVHLEVLAPEPCWGALRVSGLPLLQWKLHNTSGWRSVADCVDIGCKYDPLPTPHGAAADSPMSVPGTWPGPFSSKWTSQEVDHVWPIVLRFLVEEDSKAAVSSNTTSSSGSGQKFKLQLHASLLERTPALRSMVERIPPWVALSYESTTFVSNWEF